jgi:hypothetical protein
MHSVFSGQFIFVKRLTQQSFVKLVVTFHFTDESGSGLCSVDERTIIEYGVVGGLKICKGTRSTKVKPTPVSLFLPEIL